MIIGIVLALAGDNFGSYRLQITNFLAIATVFAVLGVNSGIFNTTSFQIAIGAGWLVLAVVNVRLVPLILLPKLIPETDLVASLLHFGGGCFVRQDV